MSARDRLFQIACDDMPVTSNEVNEAIDAYAHELAEKVRQGGPDARGLYAAMTAEEEALAKRLAGLIDPEVSDGV